MHVGLQQINLFVVPKITACHIWELIFPDSLILQIATQKCILWSMHMVVHWQEWEAITLTNYYNLDGPMRNPMLRKVFRDVYHMQRWKGVGTVLDITSVLGPWGCPKCWAGGICENSLKPPWFRGSRCVRGLKQQKKTVFIRKLPK
jgi:hypothetical protein